jgi:hypothetical protein
MTVMTPQEPNTTGRFVTKSLVRPPVEVDCSTWGADSDAADELPGSKSGAAAAGPPRATGRFVKQARVRPAVAVDCSAWPEAPTLCLELTIQQGSAVDPV